MTGLRTCFTVTEMIERLRAHWPDPVKVDRVLSVALTVALWFETWLGVDAQGHRIAVTLGGTLTTVAVAFRRRHPEIVGVGVTMSSVLMQTFWPSALISYGVATICCMYALAVWTRTRVFALTLVAYNASALVFAALPVGPGSHSVEQGLKGTIPFLVVSTVVMLIVRQVIGTHNRRAEMAERERDLAAREAVVEERARIARELHDVIAHNVSMMVVQAGAERRVLEREEDSSTREVLATVEQIGRSALTEMRRLVGMLRTDGVDSLAPQPGLDDVPALVTQVCEAGLPVELHVEGERRELPAGIELSAYRIVQEALTNALKHAGNAHAEVRIRYGPESLELEIVDDGPGAAAPAAGGHGLVGMRERVALYGGRLDAGRRAGGGFEVSVKLPVR
jgi:signal transduction histidine kinase